jgi:hypothetical protein
MEMSKLVSLLMADQNRTLYKSILQKEVKVKKSPAA